MDTRIKKPNFFIIGAPKCGTTALSEYLRTHPDVFFSNPKEPHYFNTDFSKKQRKYHTEEAYLKHCFSGAFGYKAVGEGSVFYLYSEEAVPNILQFNPNAKFIVMLRNPIDMAYSLYGQYLKDGIENASNFEAAWRLQEKRKTGNDIPFFCLDKRVLSYGEMCSLGEQVKKLQNVVPNPKNVLYIFFDDFKNKPQHEYQRVLHFLNLKDDRRNQFPVVNQAQRPRSMLALNLINFVGLCKRTLGIRVGLGFLTYLKRKKLLKKAPKKQLNSELTQELRKYFDNDIQLLSQLTDRDLSSWTNREII